MKKFLIVTLALVMLIASIACAAQPAAEAEPAADPAAEPVDEAAPAEAADITVGCTWYSLSDQFVSTMAGGAVEQGAAAGITVDSQDGNNDSQTQMEQVRTFAVKGYDALIVQLVDSTTGDAIIKEAGDIPIIFCNHRPDDSCLIMGKTMFCGSLEYNAGKMQAEFLAKFFEGRTDPIRYVMWEGTPGYENARERTDAALTELANAGFTLEKVVDDTANWDRAEAMDKMQTFLGTGAEFDCVICNNDEMALGCIEAMKAAGIDLTKIPVVGIDATEMGCEAIKNGDLACSVYQDPALKGRMCIDYAIKAAKGELDVTEDYDQFILVTAENVADYIK